MAIKNLTELGENLQKIMKRLLADQVLCKYLYYTGKDPLNMPDLSDDDKIHNVYEKLIKITPKVENLDDGRSVVVMRVINGYKNGQNTEFKDISIALSVFCPLTQMFVKSDNLRPFIILGRIQECLEGKTINGLGKLSGGDFELVQITDDAIIYDMNFSITSYD